MKKYEITNKSLRTYIFADDIVIEKKTGQLLFYKDSDIQLTSDELVGIAPSDSIIKLINDDNEGSTKPLSELIDGFTTNKNIPEVTTLSNLPEGQRGL